MNTENSVCHDIASKRFLSRVMEKLAATFINTLNTSRLKNLCYARIEICLRVLFYCFSYIKIQRSSNHAQKSHIVKSFS